jgi:hypothetical protein
MTFSNTSRMRGEGFIEVAAQIMKDAWSLASLLTVSAMFSYKKRRPDNLGFGVFL